MRHHPSWSEVKQDVLMNEVPLDATCAVCRWWHPTQPSAPTGYCRRYAPSWTEGWPLTNADTDVCGEWTTDYMPEERTGQLTARRTRK